MRVAQVCGVLPVPSNHLWRIAFVILFWSVVKV
ncbi:hypothetical protein GBAR_LOCUS27617 [Geodia barretti]|uniref:Uncharacterized protein n=1 Tax=Geodia barretti TaxID=519541 RepID=A0AA35TNJ2_GEOBA|nr:hypothetical protein GBAR_LOCUS27617 [Geodia barretti]